MEIVGRRGFIFSLDAFVAFTLIMMTVGMLVFIIGTPKSFYPSLEQAQKLAHDTLHTLATSSETGSGTTYLEQIVSDRGMAKPVLFKVAGGSGDYPGIIPRGFGYMMEEYDFAANQWGAPIYDSGTDCSESHGLLQSDRCGREFSKLRASSMIFVSAYESSPSPGEPPYCYLSCFGYPLDHDNERPCDATPCNVSKWNFYPGSNSIRLVRLTVYA